MSSWHVETDLIALMIFVIMLIKNRRTTYDTALQHRTFFVVLILSIVYVALDLISSLAMNYSESWLFYETIMTAYVMIMPVLAVAWYSYSFTLISQKDEKSVIKILRYSLIPYIGYLALAVSNPATGLFFRLTKDMSYSRGPLITTLGIGMILLYSVMAIIIMISGRKVFDSKADGIILIVLLSIASVSIFVQMFFPGTLVVSAAYAVVYIFCDMTVEKEHRNLLYTEIERQNETLKAAIKEAEEANQAKNDFLSRMSHDIRTPMNGIIGMTRIAMKQDNPPKTEECLKNINTSSGFLLGLVNDILDMQKVDSGSIVLHEKPYLMAGFNDYVNSVIKPLYEEKHQTLYVETHPVKTVIPIMDELRFNQIIFNLLSNAVKYTPEGGAISLIVMNELISGHKERITATVSDNGIGISEDFQKILFDPYSQEERDSSSEKQGTGLGLAIVSRMVKLMGGTITVDSQINKGTTFTVVIDFDYIEADQATWVDKPETEAAGLEELEGKHVLLCEDNSLNAEIARALLEEHGMIVETAADGKQGIDAFARSEEGYFDVVLMDIRMPHMNGYEASGAIRALDRNDAKSVPIVAMTANVFVDDIEKSQSLGMNGHIAKPLDPQSMFKTILEVIHR